MARKLTDDYLKWTLQVDGQPAANALSMLEKNTKQLTSTNKSLALEMEKLRAKGKENSIEYQKLDAQYKTNNATLSQSKAKMAELRQEIGVSGLSARQLRTYMKELKNQMDDIKEGKQSEQWQKLNGQFQAAKTRLNDLNGVVSKVTSVFGSLKSILPALGIGAVVAGVTSLISKVIGVRGEFEKYEAVLENTYKSHDKAVEKMGMLSNLAAQLPVSLREVTEGFIKLKNRGMEPTEDQIVSLTDVAMSQGKSLDQFVEALLDAQTGEYERLKEFGIRASSHGDKVSMTFKGVTTTIAKTDEAMTNYIMGLGKLPGVAGSSAAVMNTLQGKISNLGDSMDRFFNAMGEGKLGDALKNVVGLFGGLIDKATSWMKVDTIKKMQDEGTQVNILASQLLEANVSYEDRKKLLGELASINPELINGLNAENLNYELLSQNLEKYNEQLINKIIIEKENKKVSAQNENEAKAREKAVDTMNRLRKAIQDEIKNTAHTQKEYSEMVEKINNDTTLTLENKIKAIEVAAGKMRGMGSNQQLGTMWTWMKADLAILDQEKLKTKEVLDAKKQLMLDLGLDHNKDESGPKEGDTKTVGGVQYKWTGGKWEKVDGNLNEDQKKKALEKALKEEEDIYLQNRAIIKEKFLSGKIADEEEYQNKLSALENKYNLQRIETTQKFEGKSGKLQDELVDTKIKEKERVLKHETDVAQDAYSKRLADLQTAHANESMNDATYKAETLKAEFEFLEAKKQALIKAGKSTVDIDNEIHQKTANAEQEFHKLVLEAQKAFKDAEIENLQDAAVKAEAIENQRWEEEKNKLNEQLLVKQDLTAKEIEYNDVINKTKEEKEKAHQEKLREIKQAGDLEIYDLNILKAENQDQLDEANRQKAKAVLDAELKDANGNQLKIAQAHKKYNTQIISFEKEKADRLKEIRMQDIANAETGVAILATVVGKHTILGKALFAVQQGLAIAKIWVEKASSDAAVYFQNLALFALSGPLAPAAAAAASAPAWAASTTSATLNTGLIAAQTIMGLVGKKTGGYTKKAATDDEIVYYGHSNEFVSTADAVRNDTIKPVLDIIDYHQKNGTIKSLNLPAMVAAANINKGMKTGGYSTPSDSKATSLSNSSANNSVDIVPALMEVVTKLSAQLSKPIKADVSLLGKNGLQQKQAELDNILNNVNL